MALARSLSVANTRCFTLFCAIFAAVSVFGNGGFLVGAEPDWHQESGFRWAELSVPTNGKTGFKLLRPEETGITFTNTLEERTGEANRVLFNGSGVAIGDIDNDGLPDL